MENKTGLESFLTNFYLNKLKGKKAKIGIITNSSAVDHNFNFMIDLFRKETDFEIKKLFAPEHGLFSVLQDMIPQEKELSSPWNLEIESLYGDSERSLKPDSAQVKDLDLLFFDIQDIGSRYYTYLNTMAYAMETCNGTKVKFFVLDRPNPIGLEKIESCPIKEGFHSFVGSFPIPNRHALSAGEFAKFIKNHLNLDLDLEVVPYQMKDQQTAFPWVYPSPNMPTKETALVYPGQCLIEGTELSEGRGSTRPFQVFGAPYIKPWQIVPEIASMDLPGVLFRPLYFMPTFQKHANKVCGGFEMHVTCEDSFRPLKTTMALLWKLKNLYPEDFKWRKQAYEFVDKIPAIDLLIGNSGFRDSVDRGKDFETTLSNSEYSENSYMEEKQMNEFFIYERNNKLN